MSGSKTKNKLPIGKVTDGKPFSNALRQITKSRNAIQRAEEKATRAEQETSVAGTESHGSSLSNRITLDPVSPIPFGYSNKPFYGYGKWAYVPFLNPDDTYGNLLLEAHTLSYTTNACIKSKVRYITGSGLKLQDASDAENDEFNKKVLACVNNERQSMNGVISLSADTTLRQGNIFAEIVRGKVGGTKYVKIYIRNNLDCRLIYPNDANICESVLLSRWFRKEGGYRFSDFETLNIPLYSDNSLDKPWWKDERGDEHTIIHIANRTSGIDHYGLPDTIGALELMLAERNILRFNLDDFDNNLSPGGLIHLKGSVTPEEGQKLSRKIIQQHTGQGKNMRWMVITHPNDGISEVDVKPFVRAKEGHFIELKESIEASLYIQNQWSKILMGGEIPKGLGTSGSAFVEIFNIANDNVIKPIQQTLIDGLIVPFFKIYDEWMGTKYSEKGFSLKSSMPGSFLGNIDANKIVTVNEARELMDMQPLPDTKYNTEPISTQGTKTPQQGGAPNVQN